MPFSAGAEAVGICQARHNSATDIGAIRKSDERYPILHTVGAANTSLFALELLNAANASSTLSSLATNWSPGLEEDGVSRNPPGGGRAFNRCIAASMLSSRRSMRWTVACVFDDNGTPVVVSSLWHRPYFTYGLNLSKRPL